MSWENTPAALMTARPATRAMSTPRQIEDVTCHRAASQPAVTSLAASIATAMPTTDSGAPGNRTVIPRIENHAAAWTVRLRRPRSLTTLQRTGSAAGVYASASIDLLGILGKGSPMGAPLWQSKKAGKSGGGALATS